MSESVSEVGSEPELTIPPTRYSSVQVTVAIVGVVLPVVILIIIVWAVYKAIPHVTLGVLTRSSWWIVGFAAAVGVASAGTIQVAKQVLGVRGRFQHGWVMEWVGNRGASEALWADWRERQLAPDRPLVEWPDPGALADSQRRHAVAELQTALLGGLSKQELRQVFDLPIEQLCAQIGVAADLAMSQPRDYAELLLALAGPARLTELDSLVPPSGFEGGRIIRERGDDDTAYLLVAQGVRTGVDLMQISIGQRWQRGIRRGAVIISGTLGIFGAFLLRGSPTALVLFALSALVLGGFFAWLTRDLVAIVERVRR